MRMLFYISIGLIVLCILVLVYAHYLFSAKEWKDTDYADIQIGNLKIRAEVAAGAMKKSSGLSARPVLDKGTGMLFIFLKPYRYPFWMHGMLIPLDFIWIRDGIVVDITKNVAFPQKGEFPKTVLPSESADMVLEVNAGLIDVYFVQIGDVVEIKKRID